MDLASLLQSLMQMCTRCVMNARAGNSLTSLVAVADQICMSLQTAPLLHVRPADAGMNLIAAECILHTASGEACEQMCMVRAGAGRVWALA